MIAIILGRLALLGVSGHPNDRSKEDMGTAWYSVPTPDGEIMIMWGNGLGPPLKVQNTRIMMDNDTTMALKKWEIKKSEAKYEH